MRECSALPRSTHGFSNYALLLDYANGWLSVPFSPRGGTSNLSFCWNRYNLKFSISRTGEGCISSVMLPLKETSCKILSSNLFLLIGARCKRKEITTSFK